MRRGSIGKASTFKLYAARAKYQAFLENIEKCTVAQKYPSLIDVSLLLCRISSPPAKAFTISAITLGRTRPAPEA